MSKETLVSELSTKGADTAPFGILLVNLGSPDAPTPAGVRKYLAEFLSDPRVVSIPKWIWLPILHGIVLRTRPKRVAHAYATIWRNESPLIEITRAQASKLRAAVQEAFGEQTPVEIGMRYGNPSLTAGLMALRKAKVQRVVVLPLYPQYSVSTTATVIDRIGELLRQCWHAPNLRYVPAYYQHPQYIQALADSVRKHWQQQGRAEHFLMSFHGLPKRHSRRGDPYEAQCFRTAELLAQVLALSPNDWSMAFQSRFGREEWLQPYLEPHVQQLAEKGVKTVDVICPGFSADCLETLEEIAIRTAEVFTEAGGTEFRYISALNDDDRHIEMMVQLIQAETAGWSA